MRCLLIILFGLPLLGCGHVPVEPPTAISPICEAMGSPIKYNTYKLTSPRHAGPALAPDLKRHNQVGSGLGCPDY